MTTLRNRPETIRLDQCSLQHTDPEHLRRRDIMDAFRGGSHVIGFTETTGSLDLIRQLGRDYGYRVYAESSVALAIGPRCIPLQHGWTEVLEAFRSPLGKGSHSARGVLWVRFITPEGNDVTAHEAHWTTAYGRGNTARDDKSRDLTAAVIDDVLEHSTGPRVAFWLGDTNQDEGGPLDRDPRALHQTFRRAGLVSIFDELRRYPDTHGRRTLDIIGRHRADTRCKPTGIIVHRSTGGSDHRRVTATYRLRRWTRTTSLARTVLRRLRLTATA